MDIRQLSMGKYNITVKTSSRTTIGDLPPNVDAGTKADTGSSRVRLGQARHDCIFNKLNVPFDKAKE